MTDGGPGTPALGGSQFAQLMEAIRSTQMRFDEKLERIQGQSTPRPRGSGHQGPQARPVRPWLHLPKDRKRGADAVQ